MENSKKAKEEKEPKEEVPKSWENFVDFARRVVSVPKEEIDRIEEEEQRQKGKRKEGEEDTV